MNRLLLASLLCSGLLACSSDQPSRTEIIVTVTSDLDVPEDINRLTIDVTGVAGETDLEKTQFARGDLTEQGFPRTLTLVHHSGPLGPILVIATGLRNTKKIVERKAQVSFQNRISAKYEIHLERACQMVECEEEETCKAGECGPIPTFKPSDKSDGGAKMEVDAGGDAGPDMKPDTGTVKPDSGEPKPDGGGPGNDPPQCEITQPTDDQRFSTSDSIELKGTCTDPESGALKDAQIHWSNSAGKDLGSGRSLKLGTLGAGDETFTLCAPDPEDDALIGACASVAIRVGEPKATIDSVEQGSLTDSPYAPDSPIAFSGSGMGFGSSAELTYNWHDNTEGDFGDKATATLDLPQVGTHTVTFTVSDGNVTVEDTATFDVIDTNTAPVRPYDNVNATLNQGATALAVDLKSQVLAANGTALYRFKGTSPNASAADAFSPAPTTALATINQIFIWKARVYLATSAGLVVCDYVDGKPIDGASCVIYNGNDFPSNEVTAVSGGTIAGVDILVVGTANGLFVPDNAAGSTTTVALTTPVTGRITGIVQAVAFDSNPNVLKQAFWFTSTNAELRVYWPKEDRVSARSDGGNNRQMRAVGLAPDNMVWVACDTGLGRWIEKQTASDMGGWIPAGAGFVTGDGLPSNNVATLVTQRVDVSGVTHDLVWLGSSGGLTRVEALAAPTFMTLTAADDLPSDSVIAIALLPNGNKVVSTTAGLALYTGN